METAKQSSPIPFLPKGVEGAQGRKIILVIDDNRVFQKTVLFKLKAHGYDVIAAEDGSEASIAIGRVKPDLILLDLNFPPDVAHGGGLGWDGFLILHWLRQRGGAVGVPVIAVTGADLNLYSQQCREAGVVELLAKPLDHELLVAKIRALLNQPQPATTTPPPPPPNFQPVRRILFVDDDSPWNKMALEALSQQGYEVVTTHTGEGALREAARIRPDLMILDLKLAEDHGVKVMCLLLATHPSVPLLAYAGLGLRPEQKSELTDLGVFQVLQKRSMEELLTAVRLAEEQPRRSVESPEEKNETTAPMAKIGFDTILIVEDDPAFTDVLRNYLESESFYVTCVSEATEALRQIASTDFDLILSDMVLPGASGQDLYHEVERLKPELCRRFIFMTGHQAEPRTDAFIRRVRAFMLWKPFQLPDLLTAVHVVLRKDRLARAVARGRPVTAA